MRCDILSCFEFEVYEKEKAYIDCVAKSVEEDLCACIVDDVLWG